MAQGKAEDAGGLDAHQKRQRRPVLFGPPNFTDFQVC